MRRLAVIVATLGAVALVAVPRPAAAEVQKAAVAILGGMQCSL